MDAPYYNGGPDEGQCRTLGRRREPDHRDWQPVCHRCGNDCITIHAFPEWTSVFCSQACLTAATTPITQKASA